LIDDACNAKLCDFALVRLIQEDDSSTGMTTTTAHTGTARYLARELVECEQIPTPASDIHALGCLGLEVNLCSERNFSQLTDHHSLYSLEYPIRKSTVSRGMRITRFAGRFLVVYLLHHGRPNSTIFSQIFGAYWNHAGKIKITNVPLPMPSSNILRGMTRKSSIRGSICSSTHDLHSV
jgi:hypothetical protein